MLLLFLSNSFTRKLFKTLKKFHLFQGEEDPIGYQRLNENLNRGMIGSDVYISYKLSPKSVNRASYRADVLSRLPKKDHSDIPLSSVITSVPIFALPSGNG